MLAFSCPRHSRSHSPPNAVDSRLLREVAALPPPPRGHEQAGPDLRGEAGAVARARRRRPGWRRSLRTAPSPSSTWELKEFKGYPPIPPLGCLFSFFLLGKRKLGTSRITICRVLTAQDIKGGRALSVCPQGARVADAVVPLTNLQYTPTRWRDLSRGRGQAFSWCQDIRKIHRPRGGC